MIQCRINKELNSSKGKIFLDAAFEIKDKSFVAVYGPSGAGKTTLLRILSGLTKPGTGYIRSGDTIWFDSSRRIDLPVQKRKIGFVFQDYSLFPNMTVKENLHYALEKGEDPVIIKELIEVMELHELLDRTPETLSGGQKQRVALARALVRKPGLLLLDEPLSALDNEMRTRLQDHILNVHRRYGLTTILVSHDISEISKLADEVLVIDNGRITKRGRPADIFQPTGISGKFRFTGEVLSIEKEDVVNIVTVLVGNNIVKVIAMDDEVALLAPGSKVMLSSKAFNPAILPITNPV